MFHLAKALSLLALCLLPSALIADSEADTTSLPQDDETALIQHSLHTNRRDHGSESIAPPQVPHVLPPSGSLVQKLQQLGTFDCKAHPGLCKPPFDCHQVSSEDVQLWLKQGAAPQGAPNYKLWCALPHYEEYASACAAGDLASAGQLQFRLTSSGHFGAHTKELDGSACFIEGHCANKEVTNKTTVQEAVGMCDQRFGRQVWASWGSEAMPLQDHLDYDVPADMSKGYQSPQQSRPTVLAACAMGNYHCDVMYCRETYCKDEYYVKKYGGLLKAFGWVE